VGTIAHESMEHLKNSIKNNRDIWIEVCHENCIKIHPKKTARATKEIESIKLSILNNELPGLLLKDCFTRHNVFTITVCINTARNECYKNLIDTIWEGDLKGLQLYEHH